MGSCGSSYCVCLISLGTVSPTGGRCQNVPPQKAEPHPLFSRTLWANHDSCEQSSGQEPGQECKDPSVGGCGPAVQNDRLQSSQTLRPRLGGAPRKTPLVH